MSRNAFHLLIKNDPLLLVGAIAYFTLFALFLGDMFTCVLFLEQHSQSLVFKTEFWQLKKPVIFNNLVG